jgi:hypothetical protein
VIEYLSVREIVSELTFEDLQDQMKTPIFSFQSNEGSILDQLLHLIIYIPVYSIELEVHVRSKCYAKLC